MIFTNKLLPVALIAALIGGSVGALVMHKSQPAAAETTTAAPTANLNAAGTISLLASVFATGSAVVAAGVVCAAVNVSAVAG